MPAWLEHLSPVGAPGHLFFHLGRNDIAAFADLPAATERAVNRDKGKDCAAVGADRRVIDLKLLLLGGEGDRVVVLPLLIAIQRQVCALTGRPGGFIQKLHRAPGADERR